MIEGVEIVSLRQIVDERGKVMHMLKSTDPHFEKFGEIYFSCSWPGTIKAWHKHDTMTLNNAVELVWLNSYYMIHEMNHLQRVN